MSNTPKQRPDKAKVIDEVWTDERIRSFLKTKRPTQLGKDVEGEQDYYVLLRAYQAMRIHDFERFLGFFETAGGNLAARGPKGETLDEYMSHHRRAGPFVEALRTRQEASSRR